MNIERLSGVCCASVALLVACGGSETTSRRERAIMGVPAGSQCAVTHLTQPCSDCGAGFQVCSAAGTWGACSCANPDGAGGAGAGGAGGVGGAIDPGVVPAGNLDQSLTFSWPESLNTGGTCEPGRYEGTFDGNYCFGLGFGGGGTTGGFGPPTPVFGMDCGPNANSFPVAGLSLPGSPGLAFDLTASGNGEIFQVNGGKFEGAANGFIPFTADLANGKLDCSTGKFTSDIVNGRYDYAAQTYLYEGWLTADYDKNAHTLIGGRWEVWEPATFNMMGTGQMGATNWGAGTWTTAWRP
jgi:hypothetical protein